MTKIMTMLLIMEQVEKGKLKLTDKVRASEHAASMGGSKSFRTWGRDDCKRDVKGVLQLHLEMTHLLQ